MLAAIYRADDAPVEGGVGSDFEYALSIRHKIREAPDQLLSPFGGWREVVNQARFDSAQERNPVSGLVALARSPASGSPSS